MLKRTAVSLATLAAEQANLYNADQHLAHMEQALELSTQLYEKPAAYNALAHRAYFSKDYTRTRTM